MDSEQPRSDTRKLLAFTLPMAVFVTLLGMTSAGNRPDTISWFAYPAYWTYSAQTAVCGVLIFGSGATMNCEGRARFGSRS